MRRGIFNLRMLLAPGRYGYYSESVENIAMRGLEGKAEIEALMVRLRENIPGAIGGFVSEACAITLPEL